MSVDGRVERADLVGGSLHAVLDVHEDDQRAIDLERFACAAPSMLCARSVTSDERFLTPSAASRITWRESSTARSCFTCTSAPCDTSVIALAIWLADSEICSDTDARSCAELETFSAVRAATETTRDSDSPVWFIAAARMLNSPGMSPMARLVRSPSLSRCACCTRMSSGSPIRRTVYDTTTTPMTSASADQARAGTASTALGLGGELHARRRRPSAT